jgi:UDP-N-acetylmuramate: L-alanyl-gamma-D-glutamyl-meso-diaminopimelate ligase
MLKEMNHEYLEYGDKSPGGPKILKASADGTAFELILDGKKEEFITDVTGIHNIKNITSLILFAHKEGFEVEKIKKAVQNLSLVKRRQEIRGWHKGTAIIDDFAHHPRAVEATLQAISQKYPDKELNVLFEPHSATARSNVFQKEFQQAFLAAHSVGITKLNRSTSVKNASDLDLKAMSGFLDKHDVKTQILSGLPDILSWVEEHCSEKSIILVLSNGTCLGFWESDFVKNLKK